MQERPAAAMGISADDLMRAFMAKAARLGGRGGGRGRGRAGCPPAGGRGHAARANDVAVDEDAVEDAIILSSGSSEAEHEAPVAEAGVQTGASRRICPMPQDQ
eukprot:58623-Chlamydomonas_euryale.AAC.1